MSRFEPGRMQDHELAEQLRSALELPLPPNLGRRIIERGRRQPRRPLSWWPAAAAAAVLFVLLSGLLGARMTPGPAPASMLVRLEPVADSEHERLRYEVHTDGALARSGQLALTQYAMDTVPVDALVPVSY